MSLQIRSIVLYSPSGEKRIVGFKLGRVNIITGRSRTGKSAIIDIVDYCLGNSRFHVPEGIIRDTVAWYGLLLSVQDGMEVFIAKPTPKAEALSQSEAYYEVGSSLAPPAFEDLAINSNDTEIVASLSRFLGIEPNLHIPEEGQARSPLEATIRHASFYLYQDQGLVANRDVLFHRQVEDYMPQTIKDTLPFFLGVASEERIRLEHDLRLARRRLKAAQRDLTETQAIGSDRLKRGMGLVAEGQQVGLLSTDMDLQSAEDVVAALRLTLNWKPTAAPGVEDERAQALRDEIHELKGEFRRKKARIDTAEAYLRHARGYSSEAQQQLMRLDSIQIFHEVPDDNHMCPLCNSNLSSPPPTVSAMIQSLDRLREDLATVRSEHPRLGEYLDSLKGEREKIRQHINEKEFALGAVVAEEGAAEELRNTNARIARVVGRISLYLDTLDLVDQGSKLEKAVQDAQSEVDRIQALIEENHVDMEELQTSVLNRIGTQMTRWAKQLELEHSEWPFRLDLRHLTVAVDRPGRRPIPMQRIGGGENWLGCHLITLLSLHRLFIDDNRPVPRFLILDQPTQVYFVSPTQYKALDGSTDKTLESDADLVAVQRLFKLLFDFCADVAPEFQLIVLEHANLPDAYYQEAMVEPPWTGDLALVPLSWLHE